MANTTEMRVYRVGFPWAAVLGVAFVVLKLTGHVGWSWLWVTAPFWLPWALFTVFWLTMLACITLVAMLT